MKFSTISEHVCLSKQCRFGIVLAMLKQCFFVSAFVFCALQAAPGDTIQLKEKAAIVGKILSEKRDQVVVDIGYTVLVIPRNQIAKISKTDVAEPAAKPVAAVKTTAVADKKEAEPKPGFYVAPNK